ncbi:MAG TPA: sulfotransferase domain-containing protein [Terriglobales bacterium]|nr:sulfotransferase domain-containing protein [Terriglobales bacterium]
MRTIRNRVRDYVAAVGSALLHKTVAGRRVEVRPDDVFLVSYPRSGNTWIRFLIGNLIYPNDPVTFANLEQRIPSIYTYPNHVLRRLPRVLKSHEVFDPRYPRVVYIVRDPRDVAVSFYHFNIKMRRFGDDLTMDEFVDRFIAAHIVPDVDRYGCWEDHVLSWLRTRAGKKDFCLVRYEDILRDPILELKKVAGMLGIEPSSERLARAVELSSAENMRALEKTQADQWVLTKNTRPDKPFIREARQGAWKGSLSEASIRKIEQAWGTTMESLGYQCTPRSLPDRDTAQATS